VGQCPSSIISERLEHLLEVGEEAIQVLLKVPQRRFGHDDSPGEEELVVQPGQELRGATEVVLHT